MKVTLRSDDSPDVLIEANEAVRLNRLNQHIRTLHTARRWLLHEMRLKRLAELQAAKQKPRPQEVKTA